MGRVLPKTEVFEQLQKELNLNDQEFAEHIGISRSQLWRVKLPPNDKRFSMGQDFIAAILRSFPNKPFEYFFFLEQLSHQCDKATTA